MNVAVLRKYRMQLEDLLRAQLAELEAALRSAAEVHRHLQAAAEREIARYLDDAHRGLTADEAAARYAELEVQAQAAARAAEAIEAAQRRWEQKRAEVVDAARERRKMEILEQRDAQRRRYAEALAEQRAADEAAGRSYAARGLKQQP